MIQVVFSFGLFEMFKHIFMFSKRKDKSKEFQSKSNLLVTIILAAIAGVVSEVFSFHVI